MINAPEMIEIEEDLLIPSEKRLAYNFRRLRKLKEWTQEEAAEKGGVSRTYITRLERGDVGLGPTGLPKWAKVFGIDVSEFYRPFPGEERGISLVAYVSAGKGIAPPESWGQGLEYVPLPPGVSQVQAEVDGIYAVCVRGESMEPAFFDGDLLYIKPHPAKTLRSGNRAVFRDTDGTGWVKIIERVNKEQIIFKSIGYGPTIIKRLAELDTVEYIFWIKPKNSEG